jgi:hypothetical protein
LFNKIWVYYSSFLNKHPKQDWTVKDIWPKWKAKEKFIVIRKKVGDKQKIQDKANKYFATDTAKSGYGKQLLYIFNDWIVDIKNKCF